VQDSALVQSITGITGIVSGKFLDFFPAGNPEIFPDMSGRKFFPAKKFSPHWHDQRSGLKSRMKNYLLPLRQFLAHQLLTGKEAPSSGTPAPLFSDGSHASKSPS
jgi:hypothetical protein